jgi:hypothetical protein
MELNLMAKFKDLNYWINLVTKINGAKPNG